jgi:hypothetical protein
VDGKHCIDDWQHSADDKQHLQRWATLH